jgi:8-oxo-dGTP diphosphatase
MNEKKQQIVVVAFIENNKKLLILKRNKNKKFLPEYYELPGGRVEFGENEKEALKRELKEELDVNIDVGRPFHTFSFFFDENTQGIEIGYFAKLKPNEKIKLIEHEDSKLVTKIELDKYKITKEEKELMIKGFEFLEKFSKIK